MDKFFHYASPLTLVSLIVDIDDLDVHDPPLDLRRQCLDQLVAIVGEAEAISMIAACNDAR